MDNKLSSGSMEASLMDFVIIWKAALFPFSYKQWTRGKPGGHKVHPVWRQLLQARKHAKHGMPLFFTIRAQGHVRQAIIAVAFARAWLSSWEYVPWRELFLRNVRKSEESWQLKAVTRSFLRQFYHSSAGTPLHKAFTPLSSVVTQDIRASVTICSFKDSGVTSLFFTKSMSKSTFNPTHIFSLASNSMLGFMAILSLLFPTRWHQIDQWNLAEW